jgi:GNAT superfamily N-acetyltransferase
VGSDPIEYRVAPDVRDSDLNRLFAEAWEDQAARAFGPVLARSLTWICAYSEEELVGFVNVAWDGGEHAFLLDTTVAPAFQRRGIGTELVRLALDVARGRGLHWMHVDFEPHLTGFYAACGFEPTPAGLVELN